MLDAQVHAPLDALHDATLDVCPSDAPDAPEDDDVVFLDFEEYVLPLRTEVSNYARRLSNGDTQRAHDVVQDAYIRALRAWGKFVPDDDAPSVEQAVRGWMYKIVRNTFISAYQADQRRPDSPRHTSRFAVDNSIDDLTSGGDGGVYKWASTYDLASRDSYDPRGFRPEVSAEVLQAIASLDPERRRVVEMHYLQEKTVAEITLELGIPRETVSSRLYRAREVLEKSLRLYAREEGYLRDRAGQRPLEATEDLEADADCVERIVRRDDRRPLVDAQASL